MNNHDINNLLKYQNHYPYYVHLFGHLLQYKIKTLCAGYYVYTIS